MGEQPKSLQNKYMYPKFESSSFEKKMREDVWEDFKFLLKHSLLPHKIPGEPEKKLPDLKNENEPALFDVAKMIYDDSIQRIEKLEEKSFKLLSYFTIMLAIVSFIVTESELNLGAVVFTVISITFLIWSIAVSFRCLNIKGINKIYVNNIYNFEAEPVEENFNKSKVIQSFLTCALSNDNVADNTVDLFNGSKYCLLLASISFAIVIFITAESGGLLNKSDKLQNLTEQVIKIEKRMGELSKNIEGNGNAINKRLSNLNNMLNSAVNKLDNTPKIKKSKK